MEQEHGEEGGGAFVRQGRREDSGDNGGGRRGRGTSEFWRDPSAGDRNDHPALLSRQDSQVLLQVLGQEELPVPGERHRRRRLEGEDQDVDVVDSGGGFGEDLDTIVVPRQGHQAPYSRGVR